MDHKSGIATLKDVAQFFGKLPATINKAVLKGQLPPPVLISDIKCWTWESIHEHIRKRELDQQARQKAKAQLHVIELHRTESRRRKPQKT